MLPENILQSDMLDIIFDNRNKAYGAYYLRKNYSKRLYTALAEVAGFVLIFAILQQFKLPSSKNNNPLFLFKDSVHIVQLSSQPVQPVQPKQKNIVKPPKPLTQTVYMKPVITIDALVKDTVATMHELDIKKTGDKNITGEPVSPVLITAPSSTGTGTEIIKEQPTAETNLPFEHVEVMPQFPGGADAFRKFLLRNINQPDDLNAGEQIITKVKFIIDAGGSISGIEVLKSGRTDLDAEVIRVLKKMPRWVPGMQNGKNVAVYFTLPVTFVGNEQ